MSDALRRAAELAGRHLEDGLSDAERDELRGLLAADPAARDLFLREVHLSVLLAELYEARDFVSDTVDRLAAAQAAPAPAAPPARRRIGLASLAAAALLLGLLGFLLSRPAVQPFGRIASLRGGAELRRNGKALDLAPGTELLPGDEIRVARGGAAGVDVAGGRLDLESGADVRLDGPRDLRVRRGAVRAPAPLRCATNGGRVETRAGRSLLAVGPAGFRVEVLDGSAVVASGPDSVTLSAGEAALAGRSGLERGRAPDRARLDDAVRRALAFLSGRGSDLLRLIRDGERHDPVPSRTYASLALLAADFPEGDPLARRLLDDVLGRPLESTYTVALQAVLLSRLDPILHRERLVECAQFLVDGQCANGQWDYGRRTPIPTSPSVVPPRRAGPPGGDNSCSAYAALGLLACRDAGLEIPAETIARARRWWLSCQKPDGGWGYEDAVKPPPPEAAARSASNEAYGSMTASALASLLILSDLSGQAADDAVRRALDWLGRSFAPDRNPGKADGFATLHYLTALARVGQLLGTGRIGGRDVYAEGAEFLLRTQRPDGSWQVEEGTFMKSEALATLDTCLALLFLRRIP
jgi:hypothetical protein